MSEIPQSRQILQLSRRKFFLLLLLLLSLSELQNIIYDLSVVNRVASFISLVRNKGFICVFCCCYCLLQNNAKSTMHKHTRIFFFIFLILLNDCLWAAFKQITKNKPACSNNPLEENRTIYIRNNLEIVFLPVDNISGLR